jgi:hypothetical protein
MSHSVKVIESANRQFRCAGCDGPSSKICYVPVKGKQGRPGPVGPPGPPGESIPGPPGQAGQPGTPPLVQQNQTVFVDSKFGTPDGVVESLGNKVATLAQALALIAALPPAEAPVDGSPWLIQFSPGTYIVEDNAIIPSNVVLAGSTEGTTTLVGEIVFDNVPPLLLKTQKGRKLKQRNALFQHVARRGTLSLPQQTTLSLPQQTTPSLPQQAWPFPINGLFDLTLVKDYEQGLDLAYDRRPIVLGPGTSGHLILFCRLHCRINYLAPPTENNIQLVQSIVRQHAGHLVSQDCIYRLDTVASHLPPVVDPPVENNLNTDCIIEGLVQAETERSQFLSNNDTYHLVTHNFYAFDEEQQQDPTRRRANVAIVHAHVLQDAPSGHYQAWIDKASTSVRLVSVQPMGMVEPVFHVVATYLSIDLLTQADLRVSHSNITWSGVEVLTPVAPLQDLAVVLALCWNSSASPTSTTDATHITTQFSPDIDRRVLDKVFLANISSVIGQPLFFFIFGVPVPVPVEERFFPRTNILDCTYVRTAAMQNVPADGTSDPVDDSARNEIQPYYYGLPSPTFIQQQQIRHGPGQVRSRARYRTTNTSGTVNTSGGIATNLVNIQPAQEDFIDGVARYKASDQDGTIVVDLSGLEDVTLVVYLPLANKYNAQAESVLPGRIVAVRRQDDNIEATLLVRVLQTQDGEDTIDGIPATDANAGHTIMTTTAAIFQGRGVNDWYTLCGTETVEDNVVLPLVAFPRTVSIPLDNGGGIVGMNVPHLLIGDFASNAVLQTSTAIMIGPHHAASYQNFPADDALLLDAFSAVAQSISLGAANRTGQALEVPIRVVFGSRYPNVAIDGWGDYYDPVTWTGNNFTNNVGGPAADPTDVRLSLTMYHQPFNTPNVAPVPIVTETELFAMTAENGFNLTLPVNLTFQHRMLINQQINDGDRIAVSVLIHDISPTIQPPLTLRIPLRAFNGSVSILRL